MRLDLLITQKEDLKMNDNINHKINQITEQTLVVGIDIAKRRHYACVVDDRGRVLKKAFPINQSREGFIAFYQHLLNLQMKYEKTHIIVGFEPTGHYWMNLATFLLAHDIQYVVVNPMHVKKSKELDDNLQTKNDQKDAMVIAKLIRDGRFTFPRILKDVDAELRNGVSARVALQKDMNVLTNRIIKWTDRFFPEFQLEFKELGKTALAVLEKTPLPQDILSNELSELIDLYKEDTDLKCVSSKKVSKLKELAAQSIGLTEGLEMARIEIQMLVEQYRLLLKNYDFLADQLNQLVQGSLEFEYILSIPGIGPHTAVEILSETGSFTNYENPRQLIKLAGLTLRENSSGEHKGQKKISKRGRKKLRSALYRAIFPMIRCNIAFKNLYTYYIERPDNPLKKKEAMVALCSKLLKVIHGLCKKQQYFDPINMMVDIPNLQATA